MARLALFAAVVALIAAPVAEAQTQRPIPRPIPRPQPAPPRATTPPRPQPRPPAQPPRPRRPTPRRPAPTPPPPLPASILNELATTCAAGRGGYTGSTGRESTVAADFTGDGVTDYLIDARAVQCATPAPDPNRFSIVLMVGWQGDYQPVIRRQVHDLQLDRDGDAATLWLEVSGSECGRLPASQRCRRRVDWNPQGNQFVYGRTLYIDAQGQLSERPSFPAVPSYVPAEFARSAFSLGRGPRGGCDRFYREQHQVLQRAYTENNPDTLAGVVTSLDCDTDMGWFLLGHAAELYGLPEAAYAYYDRAIRRHNQFTLALHSSCVLPSLGACWGLDIPALSQAGMTRTRAR